MHLEYLTDLKKKENTVLNYPQKICIYNLIIHPSLLIKSILQEAGTDETLKSVLLSPKDTLSEM